MFDFPQLLLLRMAFFILAFGLPMLFAPKSFMAIMDKTLKNFDIVRVRAFFTMLIGFLFLSVYQKFNQGWAMLFSIFGYISLLKGLILFRFPAWGQKKYKLFYANTSGTILLGIVCMLFSLFLIWVALMKI